MSRLAHRGAIATVFRHTQGGSERRLSPALTPIPGSIASETA